MPSLQVMETLWTAVNALIVVFVLVSPLHVAAIDECEVARQRRCRQNLVAELDKQSRGGPESGHQLEERCRKLEDNLNCLVLQVARCPTPNRSGDLIDRVWNYMQQNCDAFGGWWSYDCFHLEEMKKCEKIFALRDSRASQASCREYDRFRHCTSDVVQKRCSHEDTLSMGNYLLDSAGDLIWRCPHQAAPPASPIVQEGFVGVNAKIDARKGQLGVAAEESYARGVYSSAITGEGPFVTGCNARATEEMRGCLDRHQYERDQALGARDDEDRLRKECCATWKYRRCLQNAVRIHCYDTREVDIQSAVDVIPHDKGFLCRNHWIYTCSSAQRALLNNAAIFVMTALAMLSYIPQHLRI
ncbi:hypothetical protein JTE90_002802 [Oedothorax gibbosus]|uniref:Uncharacterized protein n=1 Tax=Oedothorax gibbosus TaxID=931172 RepID=A0AAV6TUU3_9ARAC|nr:hypothetical protein JTE90_002802 [Oedothorax gibbosus]